MRYSVETNLFRDLLMPNIIAERKRREKRKRKKQRIKRKEKIKKEERKEQEEPQKTNINKSLLVDIIIISVIGIVIFGVYTLFFQTEETNETTNSPQVVEKAIVEQKIKATWDSIMALKTMGWAGAQAYLNGLLIANPVGVIVTAIVALIAIIGAAIYYYDQWGAAILQFLGPIGWMINAFKAVYDHWESIKKAFQTDGIIVGLS